MADEKLVPLSPPWWLKKLSNELKARQTAMKKMDGYYCGEHPLPFLTKAHTAKMHTEFRQLLDDSRSNFMELVVDAVAERLRVEGFRLSAGRDAQADQESWNIWQANQMDAESQTAFIEALTKGVSYLSVWEPETEGGYPSIAVEDPTETIVGYVPGTGFRKRAAALKTWTDDWTGNRRANVYLPDGIYKFEAPDTPTSGDDGLQWKENDKAFVENPYGIVPIVPLRNRPRLLIEGESELTNVYRIQNQINGFLFLLALAGYFGAHKQRWASGVKLMYDETTGRALEPWDVAVDKLITNENPDAKFGEFQQTDLDGYIKSIEQKVLHIATISRTPRHYLFQEGQSPSGDAIESAEAGLVKKVGSKMGTFGEGLEEALRLARIMGGEEDAPVDSEIVWADAQTESQAVITDAVIKQYDAGLIPWEAAMEKLGYTQTEISRYSGMRQQDALMQALIEQTKNPNGDAAAA